MITARFGDRLDAWVEAAVPFLFRLPINPNAITVAGTAVSIVAGVAFAVGWFGWGAIGILIGGVFDLVDGVIARKQGTATAFGAFLDSTLDRIEEGVVLAAVATWFAKNSNDIAVGATVLTVIGSYMVSYTRARAEALGVECKVGIASRAVRVVILSAGLLFAAGEIIPDFDLLEPAIYAMAALTIFTTFQRVLHVRKQLAAAVPPV